MRKVSDGATAGDSRRSAASETSAPSVTKAQSATPSSTAEPQRFYQTREVVEILGISRRQLQYWAQTNLVTPSAKTPGGHRRYSFADLVALKAAKRLIDAGVSVQRIRSSIQSLRETLPTVQQPLSELVLVATGDIVLVFKDGAAFEAITGQEWVFQVAKFQREVDSWRRETSGRHAANQAAPHRTTPPSDKTASRR